MKRIFSLAVTLVVASLASSLSAQQPAPPRANPPAARSTGAPTAVLVAVIDVSHVFKQHEGFKARMELIKNDIKAFETDMQNQQKTIKDKAEQLKNFNPTSPEYKAIELEATRFSVDLQAQARLKRKDILEKEARQYYDAYNEIQQAIQRVCDRYNIGLVLRFDREQIDPNDRASVLKGVNRAVVFQRKLDITDHVLAEMRQIQNARRGGPAPR